MACQPLYFVVCACESSSGLLSWCALEFLTYTMQCRCIVQIHCYACMFEAAFYIVFVAHSTRRMPGLRPNGERRGPNKMQGSEQKRQRGKCGGLARVPLAL